MKLVIRKKLNHSNLWVKLVDTETKIEVKFYISFSSARLTNKVTESTRPLFKEVVQKMNNIYKENANEAPVTLIEKMEELFKQYV